MDAGGESRGHVVSGYAMCNALGAQTGPALEALWRTEVNTVASAGRYELPFQTVLGECADALQPLPAQYSSFDVPQARLAWHAVQELRPKIERALRRHGAGKVGIILGTSTGGIGATELSHAEFHRTGHGLPGFSLRDHHAFDAVPRHVAAALGARGPAYAISTACSSSAKALGSALRLIDSGICDAVLVGGVDSPCEMTLRGFHALGVLSEAAARPFSAERDGIHIGVGAAWLLIERGGEGAVRLLAVGESSDAHAMSAPHPEGRGARQAMAHALALANCTPAEVDYVNAHGTGTKQNDAAESIAIHGLLGANTPVSSTKGLTGHMLGAAGATEAVIAAACIEYGRLPANAGAAPVDPACEVAVVTTTREAAPALVLSNSFAFGGSNACVALGANPC